MLAMGWLSLALLAGRIWLRLLDLLDERQKREAMAALITNDVRRYVDERTRELNDIAKDVADFARRDPDGVLDERDPNLRD
jgi:hypothetical protein